MRLMVGVVSAVSGDADEEAMIKCIQLGRAVARHGMILLTGADPGLPYAATRGAQAAGGMVVGLSPAGSREEHERVYQLIVDGFDALLFTGVGRAGALFEVTRSVDMLVVAGSGKTMLNACALAHDLGKLVGVLPVLGGAEDAKDSEHGEAGALRSSLLLDEGLSSDTFLDDDPVRLIDRLTRAALTERFVRPGVFVPQTPAQHATR